MNQRRTELCLLSDELRRGPGVRVVAGAEHRNIDEVSRRGSLPDLGVTAQIDPLINPVPDPVSPASATFGRAIGCRHTRHSPLGSLLEGIGVELSVSPSAVAHGGLDTATQLALSTRWASA